LSSFETGKNFAMKRTCRPHNVIFTLKRQAMKKLNFILLFFFAVAALPSIALAQSFHCLSESFVAENGFNVSVSSYTVQPDRIGDVGINLGKQHGPFYEVIDFFAPIQATIETEGELKGFYKYDVSGETAKTVYFYMPPEQNQLQAQAEKTSFQSYITLAVDPNHPTYVILNCKYTRTK
jgi:hypothetical protein